MTTVIKSDIKESAHFELNAETFNNRSIVMSADTVDNLASMDMLKLLDHFICISEVPFRKPREAAEIAFALAEFFHAFTDEEMARFYGLRSITFFEECQIELETDSIPQHPVIAGIQLPDRIHEGVVRNRMRGWGLIPR